jgi:hypothetical protein
LNEVVDNPNLEEEFQEVFTFVENVTVQKCNPDNLSSENIEKWNKKFDDVLKELLS